MFELDFRIVRCGEMCWIIARGQGGEDGLIDRVMFGVFLDATQRKEAEQLRDDLAGEMSHRVKNVFALASSMVAIAARSAPTPAAMADDRSRRLQALAVAHDLVRPTPGETGHEAALLKDLFAAVLAPYDENGCIGGRIHVDMPDIFVGNRSATTLALVIHELATNSVKYGALSAPEGSLRIGCTSAATDVAICWRETGGPPLSMSIGTIGVWQQADRQEHDRPASWRRRIRPAGSGCGHHVAGKYGPVAPVGIASRRATIEAKNQSRAWRVKMAGLHDARLCSPAVVRNRLPILDVLRHVLPQAGLVLEIAQRQRRAHYVGLPDTCRRSTGSLRTHHRRRAPRLLPGRQRNA